MVRWSHSNYVPKRLISQRLLWRTHQPQYQGSALEFDGSRYWYESLKCQTRGWKEIRPNDFPVINPTSNHTAELGTGLLHISLGLTKLMKFERGTVPHCMVYCIYTTFLVLSSISEPCSSTFSTIWTCVIIVHLFAVYLRTQNNERIWLSWLNHNGDFPTPPTKRYYTPVPIPSCSRCQAVNV
jgi:hypothetical protein